MASLKTMQHVVRRGLSAGSILVPHKHRDGKYVASMTRFKRDYIRVDTPAKLFDLASAGYSIRMSCPGRAPSLISPESISFSVGAVA